MTERPTNKPNDRPTTDTPGDREVTLTTASKIEFQYPNYWSPESHFFFRNSKTKRTLFQLYILNADTKIIFYR